MSIFVSSLAWMNSKASGTTLLVLLAISDNAHDDGRAWPSVDYLAKKSRVSERTAQYAIRELVELGELKVEANAGPRGVNIYAVQVQNLRGANSAPVQSSVERGAPGCTQTIEPSINKTTRGAPREKVVASEKQKVDFDFDLGRFAGPIGDHFGRWRAAFPAIDVDAEVLRAAAWLLANPKNRKSNYLAFLTNWMSRAQDRAPRSTPGGQINGNAKFTSRRDRNAAWTADVIAAAFDA